MSEAFDPYQEWLGIPPSEQPPHHYRLLGVRVFENDAKSINEAADARMAQLRAAQIGQRGAESQRLLNEVAAARACLVNPRRRTAYDAQLKRSLSEQPINRPAPAPKSSGPAPLGTPHQAAAGSAYQPSGDVALLPDLPNADPIFGAPLVGIPVPDATYPTGATLPTKNYPGAATPYARAKSKSPNPLLWLILGAGAFACLACIAAGLILAGVFSSGGTPSGDGDVVQDGDRVRPPLDGNSIQTPSNTISGSSPKPRNAAAAALVDRMRREDAFLIYTFEPDSLFAQDGKQLVRDYSGHELHGVLEGATPPQITSTGTTGASMEFDGRTSRVLIPGLRKELGKDRRAFTLSLWIKPEPNQSEGLLFDVGFYASDSLSLKVQRVGFGFMFAKDQGGNWLVAPSDERPGWRHLAAVWDGTQQRLYLDGRLAASQPTTLETLTVKTLTQPNGESYEARLGVTAKDYRSDDRYFHGELDDLVMLPRAFDDAEVKALFDMGRSRPSAVASAGTPSAAKPPVATRDAQVVDLLSLVDMQLDARPAKKWKLNDDGLPEIVDGFNRPKLIFPYEPPAEYDLEVIFSQPKLQHPVSVILPKSGTSFYFIAGGGKGVTAFSVTGPDNPTVVWDPQRFAPDRLSKVLVQVRNDGVKAYLDGELVAEHQTDFSDMKVDSYRTISEKKQVAVDADEPTVFHSATLTEVSGPGRFTRTSPPNAFITPKPSKPDDVIVSPPMDPPAPATPPAGDVINLVSLLDLSQDARQVKKWTVEDGQLKLTKGDLRPKVVFPYEPPAEYDVKVVFSQPRLRNGIAVIMPNGRGESFFWTVGKGTKAWFSVAANPNPAEASLESEIQPDQIYTTVVQVRRDGVKAFLDGELLVDYKTDFSDMQIANPGDRRWFKIPETTQIAVDADDPTTFYSIELTEVSGPGKFTRPR